MNRLQRVNVYGSKSSWVPVTSGVPQGSVLGPILFVIYINDLPECVESLLYMYADDTKNFRIIKSPQDHQILQSDLKELTTWTNHWLLKFHPEKCKVMTYGNTQGTGAFNYTLCSDNIDHVLERPTNETDIGVIFDCNLNFYANINTKVNKANSTFAVIRRSFKFLNELTFLPLYKSLVRCHLEYAVPVWYLYKAKYLDLIENVQRRATKQLPGFRNLTYEERLKRLKLPTLAYRRARGDMIEVFKIVHNIQWRI